MCHCAQLIFALLVEIGFHHVGQAGLELLTSSDLPTLDSQSAGIIGMNHRTQPASLYFNICVIYDFLVELWFHFGQSMTQVVEGLVSLFPSSGPDWSPSVPSQITIN